MPDLFEAIKAKHFVDVRKHYRVIDQDTVNVLVAYDPETHRALAGEARDLTGVFCTSRSERLSTRKEPENAKEDVHAGADRREAAAD